MKVNLSGFNNDWYQPGRSIIVRSIWYFFNIAVFQNPFFHSSLLKIIILRIFGAKIGKMVVIKPSISIKYPWNIEIGDNSWIGEGAWLDSMAMIKIGNNCCLSQGAYLCTGNHDWSDPSFGLIVKPITIEDGAWIAAKTVVLPGTVVATHSIVSAGSVISGSTRPYTIYRGNPAVPVQARKLTHRQAQ